MSGFRSRLAALGDKRTLDIGWFRRNHHDIWLERHAPKLSS